MNKDGQISKDEFLKRHSAGFAPGHDRGSESRREGFGPPNFGRPFSGAAPFGRPSIEMIFGRADHNKDSKITKDEVPEFIWKRLSESDTDKDGAVSKAEMEAQHRKMRPSRPSNEPGAGKERTGDDTPESTKTPSV